MKYKTKQISTTKTTKTTTIMVVYGLKHVHNLHLEIFPVLHFMTYVHVCEIVNIVIKTCEHLDKKNRRRNFLHCTLCISLLLLFRSHLGLTLVVTLCSSITPFMELCLCFNSLCLFDGCCSLRLWWGLKRWLLLVLPHSRACCVRFLHFTEFFQSTCTNTLTLASVTVFILWWAIIQLVNST